jgi:hypothetical protein
MNFFYMICVVLVGLSGLAASPLSSQESFEVEGVDVRNKKKTYILQVEPENLVLQERTFKLDRVQKGKRRTILKGAVVLQGRDSKTSEGDSIWVNESIELKIGPLTGSTNPKQIIVFKIKDKKQTYVFELRR